MSTLRVNNMTNVGGTASTYAPGHIVQVVQWRRPATEGSGQGTLLVTNSSSFSTFMSASIVPKFSTSKILVNVSFYVYNGSTTASSGESRILRDATYIDGLTYSSSYNLGNTFIGSHMSVLDSPNTTSQITYNVQGMKSSGNTLQFGYADSGGTEHASITLMEVAV